jgi:anaerobic magnesium-protoporphyrin IX monomethyl ester cyclase
VKISISYPPLESIKGTPLLSQNRQFQWFSDPTYIYPVIPASTATFLAKNGYEIFWDDGIAEELNYDSWLERIIKEKPDLIAIETKTPVIKRHWKIIDELKKQLKTQNSEAKIALMGDHVTALPEESLENSQVDYVLTGGDYDFALLNLANHLSRNERLDGGVYYKNEKGEIVNSGPADICQNDLDVLPPINRELTKWKLYAYKNGNFKCTPGAYVMNGRDCWWGQCSFCSWTTLFPRQNYRRLSAEKAVDEVGQLIKLGAKEIMEDSGTLPVGEWMEKFCLGMIEREYNKKVIIDCNMRLNAIQDKKAWQLMKKAGFRMILFGLESANQITLDRIKKGLKVEEIKPALRDCVSAGLEPHLTVMVGYPWETKEDMQKTLSFVHELVRENLIATLQATIIIPYPGTPLYKYCKENSLFLTEDYDRFDQGEPVIKTEMSGEEIKKMTRQLYRSFLAPGVLSRKIASIRSWNDVKFITRAGIKVIGHLKDFSSGEKAD